MTDAKIVPLRVRVTCDACNGRGHFLEVLDCPKCKGAGYLIEGRAPKPETRDD